MTPVGLGSLWWERCRWQLWLQSAQGVQQTAWDAVVFCIQGEPTRPPGRLPEEWHIADQRGKSGLIEIRSIFLLWDESLSNGDQGEIMRWYRWVDWPPNSKSKTKLTKSCIYTEEVSPNVWLMTAWGLTHVSVLRIWRQWCHSSNFAVDALVTWRSPSALACSIRILQRQHIRRRPVDRTSLHPLSADLRCFQTSKMGNTENRAASAAIGELF